MNKLVEASQALSMVRPAKAADFCVSWLAVWIVSNAESKEQAVAGAKAIARNLVTLVKDAE